jgi:hypothetical protein
MTDRRHSHRHHERRLLAELTRGIQPVARPNIFVLLWRWRYELILLTGLPAAIVMLAIWLSYPWAVAEIAAIAAILTVLPQARYWLLAHARCVITAHRVRTGCAQAWIHNRAGRLPIILLTSPTPCGERVHIWCRAGTSVEDFQSARDILRSACWARELRITASQRHSHIVVLDVIRD